MANDALNAWIMEWKSRGYWCQPCASCGQWYAQQRKLRGRRSILCARMRCEFYRRWVKRTGRAPEEWVLSRWKALLGDKPRSHKCKVSRREQPRWCGTVTA